MKHLYWFIADGIIELVDGIRRLGNLFRKKSEPSLLVSNVLWVTDSGWMDRLVSYKQLSLWTNNK